jgi:D-methionine transport system substrate-binding protein
MKKTKLITLLLALAMVLGLTACGSTASSGSATSADASANSEPVTVTIGVTSDDPTVWDAVQEVLDSRGYNIDIELVNLSGGNPNDNLAAGEIDLNACQNMAYFESNIAELGYDLTPIGNTVIVPLNVFSNKISSLDELKDGDTISVPNDATNEGRALNVLAQAGVITLKEDAGNLPTLKDIESNPLNINFVELDLSALARSLDDVDAAVIGCGYVVDAGLDPVEDAIYATDIDLNDEANQPYINIIAARTEDKDNEIYQAIVSAYHTTPVVEAIQVMYKGAALPAFDVED